MIKTRESGGNYAKGLEFYDQGLLVDALAAFEAVLEGAKSNSPEAKLARFYIGETHARLAAESLCHGARAHAEKHLREALARNPKYPDLHYQLALVIAEEGLLREAMKELAIALNLSPNYAKALLTSGILAYQMGDYDEGAKRIVRAASLESRYDTPIFQSALDDHNKGDNCRALAGFQELALTNIDDISFYYDTGKNLYRSGDYKGAVEAFEQALCILRNTKQPLLRSRSSIPGLPGKSSTPRRGIWPWWHICLPKWNTCCHPQWSHERAHCR